METRSLAIGLVAVVAAFAAAFGLAKSGSPKTETAGAGVKAQSINVTAPAAVAGVEVGGTLPALKAERKAPAKKKKKAAKPASSTSNSAAPATKSPAPSTSNTSPSTPAPSQPSTPAPSTPKPSTPKPSTPHSDPGPVQSNSEEG
jgi:hypothetical protein